MKARLMCHLVASYPNEAVAVAFADGLAEGGATYLEVQFPFSDPSADGPVIQEACRVALDGGFTTSEGFRQVESIRRATGLPVYIMCYVNQLYAKGAEPFANAARSAGATALIVPDLPFDLPLDPVSDRVWRPRDVGLLPVVLPTMPAQRLEALLDSRPKAVYAAMRAGITGSDTAVTADLVAFLSRLADSGVFVFAGFGVSRAEQVRLLADRVHAVVVGSHLVRGLAAGGGGTDSAKTRGERLVRELLA